MTRAAEAQLRDCTADLLILGGNMCDDPTVVWSPDSQRTIVQDGRVVADSRAPR